MTELRAGGLDEPHPSRFSVDEPTYDDCMAAHRLAVAAGQGGYIDPFSRLFVMTAPQLAERPCCEQRCRHCPWIV